MALPSASRIDLADMLGYWLEDDTGASEVDCSI
jgi:hypothetical protein